MLVLLGAQSLKFEKEAKAIEVISLVDCQTGLKLVDCQTGLKLVNHQRGFWALQQRIFKQVKLIKES